MPITWQWATLDEVGVWQTGGTPDRETEAYFNGNIPWIRSQDLNDSVICNSSEYITEDALNHCPAKINPIDSVIIAMYGATLGKVGILAFPAATNQACCACITNKRLISKYLLYYLKFQRKYFLSFANGGNQANISKRMILQTPIPLPPIEEQRRIATKIKQLFDLLDKMEITRNNVQTTIHQMRAKILDLAVHGKLVLQDKEEGNANVSLSNAIPNFRPYENSHHLFHVPKSWAVVSLEQIIKLKPGAHVHRSKSSCEMPYPVYGANGVMGHTSDYNVESGTLLIGRVGLYCGCVHKTFTKARVTENALIVEQMPDVVRNDYLYYVLKHLNVGRCASKSSLQLSVCRKDIYRMPCPIPSLAEQKRIVMKIEDLFSRLDAIQQVLDAQLVNGE